MREGSMTWKGESGNNRMLLGGLGALFLALSLLMFIFAITGGAASMEDMAYVLLFFVVGVGCFIAMDASSPPHGGGLLILPEGTGIHGGDETSPVNPTGGTVAAGGEKNAISHKNMEGGDTMSHLERADFVFEKVKSSSSEEEAESSLRQTIGILKEKGYSDKGFIAFYDRLTSNLAGLAGDQLPEQILKNKKRVMQVAAELRKAG